MTAKEARETAFNYNQAKREQDVWEYSQLIEVQKEVQRILEIVKHCSSLGLYHATYVLHPDYETRTGAHMTLEEKGFIIGPNECIDHEENPWSIRW